jgi:uncharacterized membrane protein
MSYRLKIVTGDKNLDASEIENAARINRERRNEMEYLRTHHDDESALKRWIWKRIPKILETVFFMAVVGIVILIARSMQYASTVRTLDAEDYAIGILGGAICVGILGMFLWLPFNNK